MSTVRIAGELLVLTLSVSLIFYFTLQILGPSWQCPIEPGCIIEGLRH